MFTSRGDESDTESETKLEPLRHGVRTGKSDGTALCAETVELLGSDMTDTAGNAARATAWDTAMSD
jgi:hypothetical protein